MRINSIRLRLTLWYGCALAAILALFGGILYMAMEYALRQQIDQTLRETAAVAAQSLEEHRFGPFLVVGDLAREFPALAVMDKFFQIFGPAGKLTIQSINIDPDVIPLNPDTFDAALDGETTVESIAVDNDVSIRLLTVPIRQRGTLLNILQIGTSMQPMMESLRRLLFIMVVGAPLALLGSLLGGWLLAGRALAPVEVITRTARQIAAGDLSQRIQTPPSGDEIGRLVSTMNDMLGKLEVSFRQIRQFSGDASHELRTPLTVMKGETEFALRKPRSPEIYQATLESTLEEVDLMSQIIDDLLLLSRADLGEVVLNMVPVALDDLVTEIEQQTVVLGRTRHISVTSGPIDRVTVNGDELRLRELLLNLVDNAIKYSRAGDGIHLSLVAERQEAVLSVMDHGIGIALEDRERIFDRFYRTEAARAHAKTGTGLGLSICRWIVDAHHGTIYVNSVLGTGSTFTVRFPLA